MKKYYYSALCALASLPFCGSAFAQESSTITPQTPTVNSLVNSSGMQNTLLTEIQPWLVVGLGVAVSVLVVFLGWRWVSKFIKRGG